MDGLVQTDRVAVVQVDGAHGLQEWLAEVLALLVGQLRPAGGVPALAAGAEVYPALLPVGIRGAAGFFDDALGAAFAELALPTGRWRVGVAAAHSSRITLSVEIQTGSMLVMR